MSTKKMSTETTEQDIQKVKEAINISNYTEIKDKKAYYTRWVFTLNNYLDQDEQKLDVFAHKYCKYLIYGREKAPTTGTRHLQGYIHLLKRFTFNQMKNFLGDKISLYIAYKTDLANYRYCSKSGDFYYYETSLFGTQTESSVNQNIRPKKLTTKERIDIAWDLAKNEKFNDIDKDLLLKHGKQLKAIKMEYYSNIEENLYYDQGDKNYFHCHNLWLWGETGTGKSFFITYFIDGINRWWKRRCDKLHQTYLPLRIFNHQKTKWWCGYMGEEIIVINEVNPTFCSWYANEIKEWVDQYPFNAEVKGSNIGKIRPLFFIFTSNYDLDECFCEMRGRDVVKDEITGKPKLLTEDIKAMHRRMKVVKRTKEDKNKLVRWPCFKHLDEYLDNFESYKLQMQIIKDNYDKEVVLYENTDIQFIDETNKTIEKATTSTKRDKGKQPEKSPKKRKTIEEATTSNTSTPKNKKIKPFNHIPKHPKPSDISICEKCQRPKIYSSIADGWMCEKCGKYSSNCICPPITPLKNIIEKDDIIEINDSFIDIINDDKVVISTQNDSTSILKNDIQEIPSSPLKEKSLKRKNAILYDSQNNKFIGESSKLDICSTPEFHDSYNTDDLFMSTPTKTKKSKKSKKSKKQKDKQPEKENSIQFDDLNLDIESLNKIEKQITQIEKESNKNINNLSDDQETYNIPQFDGVDDSLMDEFGNIYKSEKQKYFISKKIYLVLKIDEYLYKIKKSYENKCLDEVQFIRRLKEYETKKQKIINDFELFKYKFPDHSNYKNIDICHYCKSGCINQCSCSGSYINNIPAEDFEDKLNWLANRTWITTLEEMNHNIRIQMKELMELDDNCFNVWKYKYRFDTMRADKTLLLTDHPYIKKFDSLSKHYSDKLCWYCNYGVRKFCECSGHFIYRDQNGVEYTEEQDDSDRDFDKYQEEDRHDFY